MQEELPRFYIITARLGEVDPAIWELFGDNLKHVEFDSPLEYTKEKFIQLSLSLSYAPKPNTEEYHRYIQELKVLMELFAPNSDKIVVPNVSIAYWDKLL